MSIVENRKPNPEARRAAAASIGFSHLFAAMKPPYTSLTLRLSIMLIGAHMSPLATTSTHVRPDPTRTRKLLLRREEINRLIGKVERAGYTLTPLDLHYRNGRIKLAIGLAKGKKQHDKREAIKEREWNREQQRLLRNRAGARR